MLVLYYFTPKVGDLCRKLKKRHNMLKKFFLAPVKKNFTIIHLYDIFNKAKIL